MRCVRVLLSLFAGLSAMAQSADLFVVITPPATELQTPGPGQLLELPVTFTNKGPQRAVNVRLHVEVLTGGAVLEQMYVDARSCTQNQKVADCRKTNALEASGSQRSDFLIIRVRAPREPGTSQIRVDVTSELPDPQPKDNGAVFTINTQLAASLRPQITPAGARVDPGGLTTFTTRVWNELSSVPGMIFTTRFTATNATLESVTAPYLWSCTIGASRTEAVCTAPATSDTCCVGEPIHVAVRASDNRGGGRATVEVRATGDAFDPAPHERTVFNLEAYRMIAVTSVADAGAGSLRAALEDAGGHCTPGPCKVVFNLPPPVPQEGWFTLVPASPLPAVAAERVIIDGDTQTAFTGDTNPRGPEVAIDGHLAHTGLVIDRPCDLSVRGLAIGNFTSEPGLSVTRGLRCHGGGSPNFILDSVSVTRNHLGVDPSGTVAWPNLRGLRFDESRGTVSQNVISGNLASGVWLWSGGIFLVHNRIGVAGDGISAMPNGASGVFVGPQASIANIHQNIIANHPQMGVAAALGAQQVTIRENSIRDNGGLGIDWGLDSVSPQASDRGMSKPTNAPVLLSAVYEPATNHTAVTVSTSTEPLDPTGGNVVWIDVYANPTADAEAQTWIGADFAIEREGKAFTMRVPGNHTGRWLTATATRNASYFSRPGGGIATNGGVTLFGPTHTSEVSNAVLVTP